MADLKKWFPFKFKRDETKKEGVAPKQTTAPEVWHPADEMNRLMHNMWSDRMWRDPFALLRDSDRFFGDFSPTRFDLRVDVVDEGKFIKVSAELPGVDKKDLQLSVHDGTLTIRGEKKVENEKDEDGCYRTERYYGTFQRNIPLPAGLDADRAEAAYDRGVLTVRFPKTGEAPKAKSIPL